MSLFIIVLVVSLAIMLIALSISFMIEGNYVTSDTTVPTQASRKTRRMRQ